MYLSSDSLGVIVSTPLTLVDFDLTIGFVALDGWDDAAFNETTQSTSNALNSYELRQKSVFTELLNTIYSYVAPACITSVALLVLVNLLPSLYDRKSAIHKDGAPNCINCRRFSASILA